jgi:hypothetical protein
MTYEEAQQLCRNFMFSLDSKQFGIIILLHEFSSERTTPFMGNVEYDCVPGILRDNADYIEQAKPKQIYKD